MHVLTRAPVAAAAAAATATATAATQAKREKEFAEALALEKKAHAKLDASDAQAALDEKLSGLRECKRQELLHAERHHHEMQRASEAAQSYAEFTSTEAVRLRAQAKRLEDERRAVKEVWERQQERCAAEKAAFDAAETAKAAQSAAAAAMAAMNAEGLAKQVGGRERDTRCPAWTV